MHHSEDGAKKAAATGRSREAALRVIIPRILGAVEHFGHREPQTGNFDWLLAGGGGFAVAIMPRPWSLYFRVSRVLWNEPLLVMTGEIRSDGSGAFLDGRVDVMTWQRGSQVRQWQADLFDAYPSDSDRLLRVPISGDVDDMSRLADALDLRNRGRAPSVSSKYANTNVVPFRRGG